MCASRIIAAAIVRNERTRFLDKWLNTVRRLADVLVVLDDASDDGTPETITAGAADALVHRLPDPLLMRHETSARWALWERIRAVARHDDWVLLLDADEVPTEPLVAAADAIRGLPVTIARLDAKLAEVWDERGRWRHDGLWSPWMTFFLRFRDEPFHPNPEEGPSYHASRLPSWADRLTPHPLDAPMLHLGYSTPELREAKARLYLDRNTGVNLEHARTILGAPVLREIGDLTETASLRLVVPIRNRAWVVPALTRSLDLLVWPDARLEIVFVVNGSTDETERLLDTWRRRTHRQVRVERVDPDAPPPAGEHRWWGPPADPHGPYRRMAALRNGMLVALRDSDHAAVLSLDSDVLLDPRALAHLMATGEDIVSPVFWAGWGMNLPGRVFRGPETLARRPDIARLLGLAARGKLPQVWERGAYTSSPAFQADVLWRRGLHRVGGLGAATLLRRAVAVAGVSYDDVPNLPEDIVGEDRHFCVRAACHDFRLAASSYLPTVHCDDRSEVGEHESDVLAPLRGVRWPTRWAPHGLDLVPDSVDTR